MKSIKNLRIIGKYSNQDYMLFFLRLYHNNDRDCPEIEFGTPEINSTKHGETGIQHLKYNSERKDMFDWLEQKGYKIERKSLVNFKDYEDLSNFCIYQKNVFSGLIKAKIKENSNYQYHFLNLEHIKSTVNAIVFLLNKKLNYQDYVTLNKPNCDNLLFVRLITDYEFDIFILILDCYSPVDKN